MEIVHYPHPALRWKSKPIVEINSNLRATVRKMFELMYEANGIGLAANQVSLPYRLFVINTTSDAEQKEEEFVFINPEIVSRKGTEEGEEGCLSLPELYGPVRRAEEIVVEAFDLQGKSFKAEVSELLGRVIQHENDHLDGIIFPERMTDAARREIEPRLSDFEAIFHRQQAGGEIPSDDEIINKLRTLEP